MMNEYKIMVVDDEPDILDLIEKALNIEGLSGIIKIDNGMTAGKYLQENSAGYYYFRCYAT